MSDPFAIKYRPRTLERIIGHEDQVNRLQGIIKTRKIPGAMLFIGPTSAGKTTLSRAFVTNLFGLENLKGVQDFHEINAADSRGIDDLRSLMSISRLKPKIAPRRIILIDECHQLTGPSAQLLLKPLEEPPPTTVFILATMEPEKLLPATRGRCSSATFVLEPPTQGNLATFIKRIAKKEKMDYIEGDVLKAVVNNSNGIYRNAAGLMESLQQFAEGRGKTPTAKDVLKVLESSESVDDQLAVRILVAVYANKFKMIQRDLLDVVDPFKMIGTLIRLNEFLLNQKVLNGDQHRKVWYSQQNKDVLKGVKEYGKVDSNLAAYATIQKHLVEMRLRSGSFMLPETTLISSCLFDATQSLIPFYSKSKE